MDIKVGLNFMGSDRLLGTDFERVLNVARDADRRGVDMLSFPDHLAISRAAFEENLYFGAPFPFPRETAWYEPITALAAVAAVTRRARLSVNILIAPLRPALLMAKQIATLDVISNGRVTIGLGGGWHTAEFAASGVAMHGRFGLIEDQIAACRALWSAAPASHHGPHIRFDELYSLPLPVQRAALPIYLGLPASGRHVERIARLADGWAWGFVEDPAVIADGLAAIRAAMLRIGRSPERFEVKAFPTPVRRGDGLVDLDATFARVPLLVEAGVTLIEPNLHDYCNLPADIEEVVSRLLALKQDSKGS